MDTISPAVTEAYFLLRQELYGYLEDTERLATKQDDWTERDVASARRLIPDLIIVIRAILISHWETKTGICTSCDSPWPCAEVRTIHGLIKDPDKEFCTLVNRVHQEREATRSSGR